MHLLDLMHSEKSYAAQFFSLPIVSLSLIHTYTCIHTHSGWSMLRLTPDVNTAGPLRDGFTSQEISPVNHCCENHLLISSISSFLIPQMFLCAPIRAHPRPRTQASHCHPIKHLHVGLFFSTAANVNNECTVA